MKKQTSPPDNATTTYFPEESLAAVEATSGAQALSSPSLPFSGEQILFVCSCDELHARLLPMFKSWGLSTTACHHPTAIRQDRLHGFKAVVLCGPKVSWKTEDENRLVAEARCIVECETDHPMQPRVINARLIEVSSRSRQGILNALKLAIHPGNSGLDIAFSRDEIAHFRKIASPIRSAFLESARSSLKIIESGQSSKDIQRELHNLSGSLRFLDLTELSMQCTELESAISHAGLDRHKNSLALLESQLEKIISDIQASIDA